MADWHYYNSNGEKVGPIRGGELLQLALLGTIKRETLVEDPNGHTCPAEEVKGIKFPAATPEAPPEPNPFTAPMPSGPNPFTAAKPSGRAVPPTNKTVPQRTLSEAEKDKISLWIPIIGILFLLIVGVIGWKMVSPPERGREKKEISKNENDSKTTNDDTQKQIKSQQQVDAELAAKQAETESQAAILNAKEAQDATENAEQSATAAGTPKAKTASDRAAAAAQDAKAAADKAATAAQDAKKAVEASAWAAAVTARDKATKAAQDAANAAETAKKQAEIAAGEKKRIEELKRQFVHHCGPGKQYTGDFQYGTGTFRVLVEFDEYIRQSQDKVKGNITVFYHRREKPDEKIVRSFSIAADFLTTDVALVIGEIDNKDMPDWVPFEKDVRPLPGDEQKVRNFYNMLCSHAMINIQLTGGRMQFSIRPHNGSGITLNLPTTYLAPIDPSPAPGGPSVKPYPGNPIQIDDAFFSNKGFDTRYSSPLKEYAHFDTAALEKRLEQAVANWQQASPFDKQKFREVVEKVKEEIKEARARIAKETFYRDYTYWTSYLDIIPDTNESSFTMTIPLEFSSTRIENKEIIFRSMPDVTANAAGNSSDKLNINGSSDNIRKLVENRNNYRVRVWFKSLRCRNHEVSDSI